MKQYFLVLLVMLSGCTEYDSATSYDIVCGSEEYVGVKGSTIRKVDSNSVSFDHENQHVGCYGPHTIKKVIKVTAKQAKHIM